MKEKPLLNEAVVGNGRLLVTLDEYGCPQQFFWPAIDYAQQLDSLTWGIFVEEGEKGVLWQDGPAWHQTRRYLPRTNIFYLQSTSWDGQLTLETRIWATQEPDLLVLRYRLKNNGRQSRHCFLVVYAAFNLEESPLFQAAYYDAEEELLFFYRRHTWIGVGGNLPVYAARCGRRDGESAWDDAQDGRLCPRTIADDKADGAICWDLGMLPPGGEGELVVHFIPAGSREEVLDLWRLCRGRCDEAEVAHYWRSWLGKARLLAGAPPEIEAFYHRALLSLPLLQNRQTGGIIAAPEFDPQRKGCGGYGYCWPRDAVWVAVALDEAGYPQEAAAFYRWAARTQEPSGVWYQRYWTDGSLGPSWGLIQIDETGAVLWGMAHHFRCTRDPNFLREVWPAVRRGADFLCSFRDEVTGLPAPSFDLWEERFMETTYGAAAVIAGLEGAAFLAEEMSQPVRKPWVETACQMRESLLRWLWREEAGRFGRGLDRIQEGNDQKTAYRWDGGLDASLLGLAIPFHILPPDHPWLVSTVRQVEEALWAEKVGGLYRYEHDTYRGGNPWVVTTLWLSLFYFWKKEVAKGRQLLTWAVQHQNGVGLLPEQVSRHTDEPAWVIPLAWSSAMAVLACLAGYGRELPLFLHQKALVTAKRGIY